MARLNNNHLYDMDTSAAAQSSSLILTAGSQPSDSRQVASLQSQFHVSMHDSMNNASKASHQEQISKAPPMSLVLMRDDDMAPAKLGR